MEIQTNQVIRQQPQYTDNSGTAVSNGNKTVISQSNLPPSALMQLSEGQYFHGVVTDVRNNSLVQIMLNDNNVIRASIHGDMNLNIGERIIFQVKENTGDRLVITPTSYGDASPEVISKALLGAGLPETDRNIVLVKELMNHHQPIDKEAVLSLLKQTMNHPAAAVSSLVEMNAHGISVTPENISQYENYKNFTYQFSEQLGNIAEEAVKLLRDTASDSQSSVTVTTEIFQNLMEAFSGEESAVQTDFSGMPQRQMLSGQMQAGGEVQVEQGMQAGEKASQIQDAAVQENSNPVFSASGENVEINHFAAMEEGSSFTEDKLFQTAVKEMFVNAKTPEDYRQIAAFINENISDQNDLAHLFGSKEIAGHIKEKIISRFALRPELLSGQPMELKEKIDKLYEKLEHFTQNLEKALEGTSKNAENLLNQSKEFKQNLNFMGDLNQLASFVQIPLKFSTGEANADLYVYNKKRGKVKEGETLTAFLHLDMESLGATDVHVSLTRNHVNIRFSLEEAASARLIDKHLDQLKDKLANQGYLVECKSELVKKQEPDSPVKKIFEQDDAAISIKRYLFDIRA